ncbi:MAG: prenyltransferase [Bacillota bacterium]
MKGLGQAYANAERMRRTILGLAVLTRALPVLSWSMSAAMIGAALAWDRPALASWAGEDRHRWPLLLSVAAIAWLIQGIAAHAINDAADWRSGTDRLSVGRLSGGSGVVRRGLLASRHLPLIAALALVAAGLVAHQLALTLGPVTWAFLGTGVWAAVAYTTNPLRLAYRPILGEWLAPFPAVVACTVGSCFVLTGSIDRQSILYGALHGLFCLAWLMQHHLADIPADLAARPPKMTTPAWIAHHWGLSTARWPSVIYFAAAGGFALVAGGPIPITLLLVSVGAILGACTDPASPDDIARKELVMIGISIANAVSLAALG